MPHKDGLDTLERYTAKIMIEPEVDLTIMQGEISALHVRMKIKEKCLQLEQQGVLDLIY